MEHTPPQSSGNSKLDGGLLMILAIGTFLSKITMSQVVTALTAFGAILYIINQAIQLHNNIKARKK